jgi:hypothetical protein
MRDYAPPKKPSDFLSPAFEKNKYIGGTPRARWLASFNAIRSYI